MEEKNKKEAQDYFHELYQAGVIHGAISMKIQIMKRLIRNKKLWSTLAREEFMVELIDVIDKVKHDTPKG